MEQQREDVIGKLRETDLVAEEWTDPRDGEKEVFFRNIFSTALEPQWKERWWGGILLALQMMLVMWELDNLIVLVDLGGAGDGSGWKGVVETAVTCAFMWLAAMTGRAFGLKAVYDEYTPKHLFKAWEKEKARRKAE